VRLIGDDGQQVGVVKTDQALRYAQERDLDLVEVAPEARPPVVRVLDYSKYKYEQEQKAKAARRHQKQITIREIKLRPKIATADYETKKGHVRRFLGGQDKVKITIMFRGRETTHPERGEQLLMRLAEDVADLGTVEQRPNLDGRNMTMVLGPLKTHEAGEGEGQKREGAGGKDSRRNRAAAANAPTPEGAPEPADSESAEAAPADAEAAPADAEAAATEPAEADAAQGEAAREPVNGQPSGVNERQR
jgi:translation initiation factor IF-3